MFSSTDNVPLARFPVVTVVPAAINVVVHKLEIRRCGSFLDGPYRRRPGALPSDPSG
jgi:hypothetical protein